MAILELTTAGPAELSPRRFSVHEAVSTLFTVRLWALSPDPALDLRAIVGRPASFRAVAGYAYALDLGSRAWTGVVRRAEQVHALQPQAGQRGGSTYFIEIVPKLWLLSQRRNRRIWQHLSIPDIADRLLKEWGIESSWKIDRGQYPKLEYKVQHHESDLDFLSRLLEEAGIAFTFPEEGKGAVLTLHDRLEGGSARAGMPVPYVDSPNEAAEKEFVTHVRLGRSVRPGAVTLRDRDFRKPDFLLFASAPKASSPEDRYEQYHYQPGGFLAETGRGGGGTPHADDKGIARHDLEHGKGIAKRLLEGERVGVRGISFEANTFDLAPGSIFAIDSHPHAEIPSSRKLLVLETSLDGTAEEQWTLGAHAVFADAPYRPARKTPKPKVHGLQSATVVGPNGQEIHTDEFGRVRVQFHWDREGKHDDASTCWMRVAQGWGGMGYGMLALPRIGQEVMVVFQEGDPDHPMVLGRTHNAVEQVPYKLPDHKTRSTWKSRSTPSSEGFNEIMFEDLHEKELVWQQAEKDRKRLVKFDEHITVAHDRGKLVKNDETEETGGNRKGAVEKDKDLVVVQHKRERIDGDVQLIVKGERREQIDGKQSITVYGDRQEQVEGRFALRVDKHLHLAAEDLCGEGASTVVLKGPGGFVVLDASGVTIVGTVVKVNAGGSPGMGKGSQPDPPEEPAIQEPEPEPEPEPQALAEVEKTWVEIFLVEEGDPPKPAAYRRYRIKLPNGTIREGTLDARGAAFLDGIDPGTCEVTFPDFDQKVWGRR